VCAVSYNPQPEAGPPLAETELTGHIAITSSFCGMYCLYYVPVALSIYDKKVGAMNGYYADTINPPAQYTPKGVCGQLFSNKLD